MDRLVALLVRLMVFLARHVRRMPGVPYRAPGENGVPRILLVGYNGARNTGADVRVAALVDQIDAAFAPDGARMSLMSLDPASTDAKTSTPSPSPRFSSGRC